MQLNDLKMYNPDNRDLDNLVEMLAYGNMMLTQYRELEADIEMEVPKWLEPKLRSIRTVIVDKHRDQLRKQLADTKVALEQLKTPSEKKKDLLARSRRLEQLVGQD